MNANPAAAKASESSSARPVDALASALHQLADLVDRVDPSQTTLPTPCHSWDVAALLDHVVADLAPFLAAAKSEEVDWSAQHPSVAPDWAPAFRRGADELVAHWRATDEGAEPEMPADMVTAEFAVYAWDLATALGDPTDLDPVPAERGLAMMKGALQQSMRGSEADGKAFGAEVHPLADASAYGRLAAFAGRDPRWPSPGALPA